MNTSSNKIVVILIGVIVLLGGYLIFGKSSTPGTETVPTPGATTTSPINTTTTQTKSVPKTTTTKTTSVPKTTTSTMTKDGLYVIYYTNKGFSPATLQITKGKGVRFINNSDKAMRIFADLKYDTVYSSLNESKTVGRGGTYDFVFNEAGNWAYHNENNQNDHGTVIVTN